MRSGEPATRLVQACAAGYNKHSMSAERHTRRSFLQGAAAAARELGGGVNLTEDSTNRELPRQSLLVSVRRRAMACEFEVQLAAARNDDSMKHVFSALDLVETLKAQLTIYRDDSEVIQINRCAAAEAVPVESRLFTLLEQARQLHAETDGALDITSGPLSEAWGFSRREGRVPTDEQIEAARQRVGMQNVDLDPARQTVAFRQPGATLNFNSLGKGYALDRMAELLDAESVGNYLLHGGKSSVLARGDQPGSDESGWRIGVRHPLRSEARMAEIVLHDQALSTSVPGRSSSFAAASGTGTFSIHAPADPRKGSIRPP